MSLKYEVYRYQDRLYSYIDHYRHGESHRIGGPAEVWTDGLIRFYRYGHQY